ncbi:hypothetical protein DPMN_182882 [Dreissena polymorpha]|uniref:Secreted protein n=1 Tax=Dreissena polymorpha TaxID=45954 RepID=A0A9D4I6K0_DREPO|nr:hypothetical protein DPMN_182882 [Dreissena polymorpha]
MLLFCLATCLVSREVADRRGPAFESRDIVRLYSASQARALAAVATSPRKGLAKARSSAAEASGSDPGRIYTGQRDKTQACLWRCEPV